MVRSYSTQCNIYIESSDYKNSVSGLLLTLNSLSILAIFFSELKLLKVQDIFLLIKLLFRIDFINEKISEELKSIFVINRFIYSHETLSSMVFHIPAAKMSRYGLNILRYDGADLHNKFYHALSYKIPQQSKVYKNTSIAFFRQ